MIFIVPMFALIVTGVIAGTLFFTPFFKARQKDIPLTTIPAITSYSQEDNMERGLTWNKICDGNKCSLITHLNEPINYLEGETWQPINRTFIPSNEEGYDWMIETGLMKVHFKENPTEENTINFKYEYVFNKSLNFSLFLQPYALLWRNSEEEKQLINYAQPVTGTPINHIFQTETKYNLTDTMLYEDIFGYDTNLTFEYGADRLKKTLYIVPENLPYPTIGKQGLTLDLVFKLNVSNNVKTWIKNQEWNWSTILTNKKVILKVQDKTLGFFKAPYGRENFWWNITEEYGDIGMQREVRLDYEFKRIDGEVFVAVRTPANYLNNTDYHRPLQIDPTIQVTLDENESDSRSAGVNCGTFDNTSASYQFTASVPLGCSETPTGWIFNGVNVPNSATIDSANITWSTWAACGGGNCKIKIYGINNTDISAEWDDPDWLPKDANRTSAFTSYTIGDDDAANGVYATRKFNVTNSTQIIVDDASWNSGDNMGYLMINDGTAGRAVALTFWTSDASSGTYPHPVLAITYTEEECWTYNAGAKLLGIPENCLYNQSAGGITGI